MIGVPPKMGHPHVSGIDSAAASLEGFDVAPD
jgi:hypothetical protein